MWKDTAGLTSIMDKSVPYASKTDTLFLVPSKCRRAHGPQPGGLAAPRKEHQFLQDDSKKKLYRLNIHGM
jgi:hypothetical protein